MVMALGDPQSFKITIIGDDSITKYMLMKAFFGKDRYDMDLFGPRADYWTKTVQIGQKVVELKIWDTLECVFREATFPYLGVSKGVIVTYAMTDKKSFEAVKIWINFVREFIAFREAAVVMILCNYDEKKHGEVSEERGRKLAAEYGVMFMEVSAKTGHDVERAFLNMTREMLFRADIQKIKRSTPCPWKKPDLLRPMYQTSISGNEVTAHEKTILLLDVRDNSNQPCSLPTSAIQTRLVCGSTNEETPCVVTELDRGRYEIACQPTTPGLHTLEVKVHGRPVRGSPFAVRVIRSLDTPVKMIEGLNGPRGVAVNSKGELIVCEADAKCVSIFSSTGERIRTIERINGHPLGAVGGVAVDQSDNILVLDSDSCLLRVFSPEGEELQVVPVRFLTTSNGSHLSGVCANRETGLVYIVDHSAHCVHMLTQDLTESVGKFGSQGSGNGQFNSPCDIACDSAGDVYVSDTGIHRIQVFTPDGCYLRQFGEEGSGPGELNGPIGICIDSADIVFVGELHNQRISVLTTDGEWIKCFGCEGSGPGQFDGVFGMTVDHSGVLYVSDYGNKRVYLF